MLKLSSQGQAWLDSAFESRKIILSSQFLFGVQTVVNYTGNYLVTWKTRIEDRGSKIEDRGSRIEDRGSRIEDRGSWIKDQVSRISVK